MQAKIGDVDLIAKEAKYHKCCYNEYTQCVRVQATPKYCSEDTEYCDSFTSFCDSVIVPRILHGDEILRMDYLTKKFQQLVRKSESNNTITYRNNQLKRRLKRQYPQLLFVKPPSRGCELVMTEFQENTPRFITSTSSTDTTTDTDQTDQDEGELEREENETRNTIFYHDGVRTLYTAATFLKTLISETDSPISTWPPTCDDLSDDSISKTIPPMLYNFLAWCTGESDEVEYKEFVTVPAATARKLSSVAQDIVYVASKGKKQTPKHLALGLTVRHMTGSSKLIGLLNGLGHCNSHTSTLEYDTALAEKQIMNEGGIPDGITKQTFTTLVWDNNDFGEETLTGQGTTHNTNGIIIQRSTATESNSAKVTLKRSRRRTVDAPDKEIEIYYSGRKSGPVKGCDLIDLDESIPNKDARNLDMAYIISKLNEVKGKLMPGWTGFNTRLSDVKPLSQIGYLPIIDASPTQMSTVYTILLRSVALCDLLELPSVVVVFDQAIYAKAQQICWKNEELQQRLVIRLGEFHTTLAVLAVLGKRFKDAGFRDILIESGLVAEGSVNGVLNGHHYNRSVRAHKIVYEALHRLSWTSFLDSLSPEDSAATVALGCELNSAYPTDRFIDIVKSEVFESIVERFNSFVEDSKKNATFAFWYSYLELVHSLLLFIRATREGDWSLHLSSLRNIMPWFFSYDRTNYARYSPAYWLEMKNLEKTHPYVYSHLVQGEFSVQRLTAYGFSKVACDQTIEQTANRDSKTKGGLTGISLSKGAVHRWVMSYPARAMISRRCEEMAGKGEMTRSRKDLDLARMEKDEQAVQNVISTIESMTNPFTTDCDGIVNISSGIVAGKDVENDLLRAHEVGDLAFVDFINSRLHVTAPDSDNNGEKDIFTPINLQKLKTFSNHIHKTSVTKDKIKSVSLKASSDLLGRILMISQVRKIDVKETLGYSLNPYPPAIVQYGGAPVKTNKSALMRHIEQTASEQNALPNRNGCVWIFDGMAVLQQMKNIPPTFEKLADKVLTDILQVVQKFGAERVDFVTDCYPDQSIKDCERTRRATTGVQQVKIMRGDQKTPKQFKKYLSSGTNKESLVEYMFTEWSKCSPEKLGSTSIYITHGHECHSLLSKDGVLMVQEVTALKADHEEADTRMILHASHAADSYDNVVIRSADTDVFILGIASAHKLKAQLFMHAGPWSDSRTIPLSSIANELGNDVCDALIGLHCFTGCDSVSAVKGKGKVKAYKLMIGSKEYIDVFQSIGKNWNSDNVNMTAIQSFVCALYNKPGLTSVNEARYEIFRRSYKTDVTLPPNQDSLRCHTMRANYQAAIHHRCLQRKIDAPTPVNNGWILNEENDLVVVWITQPVAPDSVMNLITCSCKKTSCIQGKCSCYMNGIKCSELCNCISCENVPEIADDVRLTETDSDGDDDDDDN